MKHIRKLGILSLCLMSFAPTGWTADDYLQLYREEEKVVSASRLPQAENQTPATIYVVTQQDIKNSGAQNIWDALRSVPGVSVIETRTGQFEVGIRGINRALNNRTLILLDGHSLFNPFFDFLTSESLPVQIDEIDRIEVVEGPASAVYGADALSGAINIITKRPEQVNGGQVSYTGGERNTEMGHAVVGKKQGPLGYRFGGGWDSTNRFSDADRLGAQSGRFDGLFNYDISDRSSLSFAGGYTNFNSEFTTSVTPIIEKGDKSFMRGDYKFHDTLLKTNWDHGRTTLAETFDGAHLDYDTYEAGLEQTVNLPLRNKAVIGSSYRRINAQSSLLENSKASEDLWSAFFEDKFEITNQWLLMTSARVDRHPLTPIRFSPRGSLLYTPVPEQVFRVSAGTSYRNPTLIENYFNFPVGTFPNTGAGNPPFSRVSLTQVGKHDLDPESLKSVEVSHTGRFGALKTSVAGYHWDLSDGVTQNPAAPVPPPPFQIPPVLQLQQPFANVQNSQLHAWGSELGLDYTATQWLSLFSNYSYVSMYGGPVLFPIIPARHQVNVGYRTHNGGLTTQMVMHWVDSEVAVNPGSPDQDLNAYFLLDAHIGYAFAGRLAGWEVGANAFNLLNHDHYEYNPLEGGEIVKGRFTGTVSYKF